jgi:hypothetical protein
MIGSLRCFSMRPGPGGKSPRSREGIDMSEFEAVRYRSYAYFFGRKFKPGERRFAAEPNIIGVSRRPAISGGVRLGLRRAFPSKATHSVQKAPSRCSLY